MLCGLMVGVLALQGAAPAQKDPLTPPAAAPATPPAAASPQAEKNQKEALEVDLNFRDPFQSFLPSDIKEREQMEEPEWQKGQEEQIPREEILDVSDFSVTGLVWGIEEARAIINGEILAVGDTIGGGKILRIDRDGILFGYYGREYLLKRNP